MRDRFPVIVHTVLWRGPKLLLLRRAGTGYLDGWYALPGGHLEAGEGIVECAVRECREEAGIELSDAAVAPLAVLPYRSADGQGVDFVMSCSDFSGEPRLAEPHRFDDLKWAPFDALPPRTVPYLAEVLRLRATGAWFYEFISD
jgi:8-oxo-dGTP pyrophosphatase MutT (NUDIX family)